jgi:Zn-dependent M28 family amino/carboxypeptidase
MAAHPGLGDRRIVANVNLDMPLVLFPFVDVIAFGGERSSLGKVIETAAASMDLKVIPDPIPEQNIFVRSDHYRFVQKGVPAVFLFTGFGNGGDKVFQKFMAENYHKPSDDLSQPIDYASAARFSDLNYRIAREIADADAAPTWNEGDFFGRWFGAKK